MNEIHDRQCFTIKDFVDATGLSEATVRRRVHDGGIPSLQFGGKHKRILILAAALQHADSGNRPAAPATSNVCDTTKPEAAITFVPGRQHNQTGGVAGLRGQGPAVMNSAGPRSGDRPRLAGSGPKWKRRLYGQRH